jgi:hypothetical protein
VLEEAFEVLGAVRAELAVVADQRPAQPCTSGMSSSLGHAFAASSTITQSNTAAPSREWSRTCAETEQVAKVIWAERRSRSPSSTTFSSTRLTHFLSRPVGSVRDRDRLYVEPMYCEAASRGRLR